jgi:GR25 family glycosyltransferase involved in LPS biosynthesis
VLRTRVNSHGHRPYRENPIAIKSHELSLLPKNTILPENALVINLDRSKERYATFIQNYNFSGTLQRIPAIDGRLIEQPKVAWMKKGDMACLRSHNKALQHAKYNGYPCVIIFEDDIVFEPDFNRKLNEAMLELPHNWDMVWMAGAKRTPDFPFSAHLKLMTGTWGAYGIIIRNTVYDFFISEFSKEQHSSDTYYSEYHSRFNSFRIAPDLVHHIGKDSDRITVNHEREASS